MAFYSRKRDLQGCPSGQQVDRGLFEYRMGKRGLAGWTEVRRMRLQVLGSNVCRLRMLKGHVRGVRGRLGMAGLRELQAAVYGAWVV